MRAQRLAVVALLACPLGACADKKPAGAAETAAAPSTATVSPSTATVGGEEGAVRAVVQEAMTSTDPSVCTRLVTLELLEQTTHERGAAALKSCRADADDVGAKTLTIDAVRLSGTRASADIRPRGGGFPFKTATLALRRVGGQWKISRLKSGELDRTAFNREVRRQFSQPPNAIPAGVVDCAVKELASTSDPAVADIFLKSRQAVLLVPVVVCGILAQVERQGVPRPILDCMAIRFRRAFTTGVLGRRIAADPKVLSRLASSGGEELGRRIGAACAREVTAAPS
ncbi:MAG TPA: hypothetical protein VL120_05925 [Solirubrobacteraceae bacterium]|nr:hypothetical protein [Solirubrobacteraceae bacterium]